MKIKVYSTPTCPYCIELKSFFKRNNVKFVDIDVSKDHEAVSYIISKTGNKGVPQIEMIDKNKSVQYFVGFDDGIKQNLKKLLKLV